MQFNQLLGGSKDMGLASKIPDAMFTFAIPAYLGVQAGQAFHVLTVFEEEFFGFDWQDKQEIINLTL
ncbi:MAG: hypothetical protein PVG39_23650 [Desulfobacteraceae bacterium]|jgi:hypothetical protein